MSQANRTEISVIVPVYNDSAGLTVTVNSLLRQKFDSEKYEILIVDNGSTDRTYDTARAISENDKRVKLLQEKDIQSSYAARNFGISQAAGDILCFIDADITVPATYLGQVAQYFREKPIDYLGCNVEIRPQNGSRVEKYQLITAFQIKKYFETSKFFPTCCLSVKKRVFDLVGKFDSRLESSGDLEFGQRVYQSGLRQGYTDSIVLSHPPRETYWALCKKSMRIARGIAQCCFYYPARYNGRKSKILDWRKFIPRNPFNLKKIYSNMNIPIRWPDAILLAFFGIPQSIMSVFAFCIEIQRLKSSGKS